MSSDGFDLFGRNDSDSDNDEQTIVDNQAFIQKMIIRSSPSTNLQKNPIHLSATSTPVTPMPLPPLFFPHHPPLYFGPMTLNTSSSHGGSRDYLASQDLPPGTLLIKELPILTWDVDKQMGKSLNLSAIESAYRSPNANNILSDLKFFHPIELDEKHCGTSSYTDAVTGETVSLLSTIPKMRETHSKAILKLLNDKTLTIRPKNEMEILRILYCLICNGFDSGVYCYTALFNHSCTPNCIKYPPTKSRPFSEMRTTEYIKKGTPLNFCYVAPRETCFYNRRKYLLSQHFFDVGKPSQSLEKCEKFGKKNLRVPCNLDALDDDAEVSGVLELEETIVQFEMMYSELNDAYNEVTNVGVPAELDGASITQEMTLRVKDLVIAIEEIALNAPILLNNTSHLLVARSIRLLIDTIALLLRFPTSSINTNENSHLACKFLLAAYNLLPIQLEYLGAHHPDIATTYNDLSEGISGMLSRDRKYFVKFAKEEGVEEWEDFKKASGYEMKVKMKFLRIRKLYE